MNELKHILLATDLSPASKIAATKAKALATLYHAKLTLAYVVEPLYAYENPDITRLEGSIMQEMKKEMAKLGEMLNIPTSDQKIEIGSVKTQLLQLADELAVDLIVVGSHGRHGLSRLLGSSASAIVHGAKCDVFVVRTPAKFRNKQVSN